MTKSFRSIEHLFWWIVVGSRGGSMRAKILTLLNERPMNANQLAEALGVNYRTVTHHLNILMQNGLVVQEGPKYGTLYFPSKTFIENSEVFMKVLEAKFGFNKKKGLVS